MTGESSMDNSERVLKILQRYEKRLQGARKWSGKYYHKNTYDTNTKRIIGAIKSGRCPTKSSVEKYDRDAILDAWVKHMEGQTEASTRAKTMHRYLTGSDWVPKID